MKDDGAVLGGKWKLGAPLGAGSMANVFAATHRNGAVAAVKILHKVLSGERDLCERFLAEGYLTNAVKHPGIVRVFDDGVTEDGRPYLVMDLLEGETLEELRLRSGGTLPLEATLDLVDRTIDVLACVHEAGIVHRDLKPTNVFLTRAGELKVLDFGIARSLLARGAAKGSLVNTVMGTPSFMSPEQALGQREKVDHQSDQWGLGAIAFLLLTGEPVHPAPTVEGRLLAAAANPARSILRLTPDLSPEVAAVIDRALAYAKEARFTDLRAMRAALTRAREIAAGAAPVSRARVAAPVAPPPASADVAASASKAASADGAAPASKAAPADGAAPAAGEVDETLPLSRRSGAFLVEYLPPITPSPSGVAGDAAPESSRQVEIVEIASDLPVVEMRESVPVGSPAPPHAAAGLERPRRLTAPLTQAQIDAIAAAAAARAPAQRTSLAPKDLTGSLATLRLPTVLTMLEMERMDGALTLTRGAAKVVIHVRQGRVVDVGPLPGPSLTARDGLRAVLAWSEGTFAFATDTAVREDRIGSSTTALLLDLAREDDEGNADDDTEPTPVPPFPTDALAIAAPPAPPTPWIELFSTPPREPPVPAPTPAPASGRAPPPAPTAATAPTTAPGPAHAAASALAASPAPALAASPAPALAASPAPAPAAASAHGPAFAPKTPFAIEPTMLTRAKEPPPRSLAPKILAVVAAATVLALVVVTITFRVARPAARAPAAASEPSPAASVDAGVSAKR